MQKLIKFQRDSGVETPKKLLNDVPTRWNSTFFMLEKMCLLQDAVKSTLVLIDKNIPPLTAEEWRICSELVKTLRPFEDVTRQVSAENYSTGSLVIYLTCGLVDVCQKLIQKPFYETVLRVANSLLVGMVRRFDKVEYNNILGTCTFLDPRFKLHAFAAAAAKTNVKEHVTKLVTYEYSLQRRQDPQLQEMSTNNEPATTSDEDSDLKVSSFLDNVLKTVQPPGTATTSGYN